MKGGHRGLQRIVMEGGNGRSYKVAEDGHGGVGEGGHRGGVTEGIVEGHRGWLGRVTEYHRGVMEGNGWSQRVMEDGHGGLWRVAEGGWRGWS